MIFALGAFFAFFSLYVLWFFFLAVIALKKSRDDGRLTPWARRFGVPILIIGECIDFLVNSLILTVLLVELPQEWLVTSRVKRHLSDDNWRGSIARWFDDQLLDPIDPGHCK